MILGDCWRYRAVSTGLLGGCLLSTGTGWGAVIGDTESGNLVRCGGRGWAAVGRLHLGAVSDLARVNNRQSQSRILTNNERCLGDCWPLRPGEAPGRWLKTLHPWVWVAGGSPGRSSGKRRPSGCGASPAEMPGGVARDLLSPKRMLKTKRPYLVCKRTCWKKAGPPRKECPLASCAFDVEL